MKLRISFFLVAMFGIFTMALAETTLTETTEQLAEVKGQVEGMNETMLEMKTTLDALAKIKISGYIQSQYQVSDGDGIGSYAGGNFPAGVHQRFAVRRGRFKINYDNKLTQYVVQLDVTQGGVGIKDAYLSIREPWTKNFELKAGGFDRPFGFEISYSSSSRETPERSRMFQVLFPGERDIGAQIAYSSESGPLSFLNAKLGVFNGMGVTANENDNNKDLIGRVGVMFPFIEKNMQLDGGVSFYMGKVRNNSKFVYELSDKKFKVDSTGTNAMQYHDRTYIGIDAQYYADLPVLGGMSARLEYISGDQPSTSSSNGFYNGTTANTPLYKRKVSGYYFNYVQNIGLKNQFVLKYDDFDPNTEVEGSDIGASGAGLTAADIQYSTLGLGWIYHWDGNVKFVFYYDMVTNETVNSAASGSLAAYTEDVKDNVFTIRLQYKF
ncbi:MAG: OprO/OprP family phosphate-selective porin [bacterium]|nr:OprO/OprP family phosphate-selective porin [bacterium]